MSHQLRLVNTSTAEPWTVTYYSGTEGKILSVPPDSLREVVAESVYLSGTWHNLTCQTVATVDGVHAPMYPDGTPQIMSAIVVLIAFLCGKLFWETATPAP